MSNKQRIQKVNKLHSELQKTSNIEDRIKLHQAAIKMIEGRENEDPDEAVRQKDNNGFGIQAIPLLSTNSRGATLSSFDPSSATEGITSSTSMESLNRQGRARRHSVSSESSTSSAGRSRKSASRNSSLSRIPAISHEKLTPDAEKRVFNYNYRGPIPTKHHCQRSLFGKTVDVTPEPIETPKRRSSSANRTPLRRQSQERPVIPQYNHRPGMHLHESSCDAARQAHDAKSSTNISSNSKVYDPKKTPPRLNKGSHENLFNSSAKKRLDSWQPLERSKSSNSVKQPVTSTPKKRIEEDSDGYAIPSVSEPDRALLNTPIRREITPPELYQTPSVQFNQDGGSGNESFESAKEFQTPVKGNIHQSDNQRNIAQENFEDEIQDDVTLAATLQDQTNAELAAIDSILAKVSSTPSKIPQIIPRSINLTPSTDYRNLKDTSVEKNFEDVQAAIKSKSKEISSSFPTVYSASKENAKGDVASSAVPHSSISSPFVKPSATDKASAFQSMLISGSKFESPIKKAASNSQNGQMATTSSLSEEASKGQNEKISTTTKKSKEKVQDIQMSQLYPRMDVATPKSSKIKESNIEMTPNTKFRTSLSRDRLIKSFKEALDINITAKKRFLKYERQYFEKIRDSKKVARIDIEMEKFPNVINNAMEEVKSVTLDYSEKVWRKVLAETEKLQNDAKEFVRMTNENKEKRRRKSLNFGLLGAIDANEFERKHFESLSRRHENALRLSEAVRKVNVERAIVELQERKAIKDLVRLSLDNKALAALSQSTSATVSRRSVTLTSSEIRKLAEDAIVDNKRKLGKVTSKPELLYIEQENSDIISDQQQQRQSLSSGGIILSSRHHARIIETQITEKLFSSENLIQIPQSAIPSAASSVVPRLDFSVLDDSASKKAKSVEPPAAATNSEHLLEDIVIPDIEDTEIVSKQQEQLPKDKTERSDGRTSRDVSSISEFEPAPAELERSSNDDKKTENDVSTIRDIEESVHEDLTVTQASTTNNAEPKPVEHLHTPTEGSIFSALPSTHSQDDLQSLPDPLSEKSNESKSKTLTEKKEETTPALHLEELHVNQQNADSDPERLPLSATTGTTGFNASPISSSRLLGDSPIPSPPFIAPSSTIPAEKEFHISNLNSLEGPIVEEDESSVTEASYLQSVLSSKSSSTTTESSKVVIPSSLENSIHEQPKPSVSVVIEPDEKSTTSVSTGSSSTTSSVASTLSKTTSSKSSSNSSSKDKPKPASAKSSGDTSIAEDLPSTARSTTSSDFSAFLPSNQETNFSTSKNTVPAEKKQYSHSPADDVSETSFSISGYSQANDHPKSTSHRRKSWDMVETGIIGKQSPSYVKNDAVDNDISGIFNNEPPKFESAPSPLGPYAAVSPRSPRGEHSRKHSFSKSPPLPKSSSKIYTDAFDNFLLDDVSLSNIAAPIFDISGGSERGSLGFKEEKNLLDWSPGLSREFPPQPKIAKRIENVQEPESTTVTTASTEDTSISTQIDERPLDRSVEGTVKEIESFCRELWPQIEASMENEEFDSLMALVGKSEDPEQHYYGAYRRLIARTLFSEAQTSLKKGFRFDSFEMFQNQMIDALLNKLSIERTNDLLDARHVWVRKNNAFTRLVQSRNDAQDFDSAIINEFKRELVGKAIAAEDIINYSNERANRFTDIGYEESVEFLRKHAPEQLAALLSQYEN